MIRFAQVIAVHPERRTVDLVFLDTRLSVAEVQVLSGSISSDSGSWDLPDVELPPSQIAAGGLQTPGRALLAAAERSGNRWVVLGFMQPTSGQVAFKQANREVHRHPSGAYTTIAPDGSIEMWHPAGAYLRIGTGAHEDVAPLAAGTPWTVPVGAPPAQITLATSGFTLTVDPGGTTTLVSQGDGSLQFAGTVDVQSGQAMTFSSGGNMTFSSSAGLAFTAAAGTTMSATGAFSLASNVSVTMTAPAIDLGP